MALVTRGATNWIQRQQDIEATGMTTSEALREALALDLSEIEQQRTPFLEWSLRVPEPKAGSLDFVRFPFQKELYEESAGDKDLCVLKATQVGVSTFLVRWTLYWADTKGLTALYVFPTRNDVYDFSDARIKPAIEGSEYLRERIPPGYVQNKGLKAIGLGFVYFRGSETKRGLDSVDADILAMDEYDTLVQANIGDAERRISGSLVGLIRRVGVPSINDFGISKEYARSDQRKWYTKCERCGEWQFVAFNNIEYDREAYQPPYDAHLVCHVCRKPGLNVLTGEWVAKHPTRSMRGYHMPRMIVGHTDLDKIVHASKEREPYKRQVHFNKDLAEPYEGEGGRLSPKEIQAAQRPYAVESGYDDGGLVTMGVDVASTRSLNLRISRHLEDGTKQALWIGLCDSFSEVADKMNRYNVNLACVDHLPEGRLARALAERFPGRVYLVRYSSGNQVDPIQVDEQQGVVSVKRTEAIDAVIELVRAQRNLLPKQLPEGYIDQMCAVVRRVERDEFEKVTVQYVKTAEEDDYLQAEVYDNVARVAWTIRQTVDQAEDEDLRPLDDMLDFERTDLHDMTTDGTWSAGPSEGDYGLDGSRAF